MIKGVKLILDKLLSDYKIIIRYIISGLAGAIIQFSGFYFFTQLLSLLPFQHFSFFLQ
jgi:putative flippase GtrA